MPSVSKVDLMVLGLLMESPRNAYDLVRLVEERQIGRLLPVSKPAIYKSCKRLYKGGFLDGEVVREGELPEKVIYTVNAKGEGRFRDLMRHYSREVLPIYFDFNSFLWHIEKLPPGMAMERLEDLQGGLRSTQEWLEAHVAEAEKEREIPFSGRMIMRQYRMILSALVEWSAETINEYGKSGR